MVEGLGEYSYEDRLRILGLTTRDATEIPEIRNSDRILGIRYNPKSSEKLNPEHRHIKC